MAIDDYEKPEFQKPWFEKQRRKLLDYLKLENVRHGGVREEPDWFLAPCFAIWPVKSAEEPEKFGWWAITGDIPFDYISSEGVRNARAAMYEFAHAWFDLSKMMIRGESHPEIQISQTEQSTRLGRLLLERAELLHEIASADENWEIT